MGVARPLQVLAGFVGPPQVGEGRNGVNLVRWRVYAVLVVSSAMAWHCIVCPSYCITQQLLFSTEQICAVVPLPHNLHLPCVLAAVLCVGQGGRSNMQLSHEENPRAWKYG